MKKFKTSTTAYYRLAIFNDNGSAEVLDFMATSLSAAVDHAKNIYEYQDHHYGCILYKYDRLDTAGSFKRITTIEEPKATE